MATLGIFWLVGVALLALGGASGAALFFRAIGGADQKDSEKATATLWGLFIVGVLGGLVILGVLMK